MNIDKRIEKNITSISNLKKLLIEIVKNPSDYLENKPLLESLHSQGKLSKYQDMALFIYPTSINTMKRLSSHPDCDFDSLNKLRIAALEKIQNKQEIENKQTYNKKDLMNKIEELELELNTNKNSQLFLLKTIYEISKTFKSVKHSTNIDEVKETLEIMNSKIKKMMSLDSSFLINEGENNVIQYDFKKGN